MNDDPLLQLLRNADASAPRAHAIAPDVTEIATAVRRRHARRARTRTIAAALAVIAPLIVIGISVPFAPLRPPRRPFTITFPGERVTKVESPAALEIDERVHAMTAERLLAMHSMQLEDRGAADTVLLDLRQQRDRAALILVYEADEHVRRQEPQQAAARYRRAIELFPQTHWAGVARQRLKEIST